VEQRWTWEWTGWDGWTGGRRFSALQLFQFRGEKTGGERPPRGGRFRALTAVGPSHAGELPESGQAIEIQTAACASVKQPSRRSRAASARKRARAAGLPPISRAPETHDAPESDLPPPANAPGALFPEKKFRRGRK